MILAALIEAAADGRAYLDADVIEMDPDRVDDK
jgi:hypothetical protein